MDTKNEGSMYKIIEIRDSMNKTLDTVAKVLVDEARLIKKLEGDKDFDELRKNIESQRKEYIRQQTVLTAKRNELNKVISIYEKIHADPVQMLFLEQILTPICLAFGILQMAVPKK